MKLDDVIFYMSPLSGTLYLLLLFLIFTQLEKWKVVTNFILTGLIFLGGHEQFNVLVAFTMLFYLVWCVLWGTFGSTIRRQQQCVREKEERYQLSKELRDEQDLLEAERQMREERWESVRPAMQNPNKYRRFKTH